MVAVECVIGIEVGVGAIVCIGLNSLPRVGGNAPVGKAPGNGGDTNNGKKGEKKTLID